ncbi:putative ribonuclease H protein [Nymphaea thermarum]|nr:putative ribonuclease H protein [Nymphaea thermarum]
MAADFLWGDMADHKSIHHIKWSTLCLPLLEGGVGFRDIKETNLANMTYLVYRASQQSSPWAALIKGRWPETEILSECLGHLANIADNMGHIYLLANDGEWKHHFLSHLGCRSDLGGNQALSNSFIDRLKICKGFPDNGLYTT